MASTISRSCIKLIVVILVANLRQFNCDCGFPGVPTGADIENLENIRFTENRTVIYKCRNQKDRIISILQENISSRDLFTGYTRTCLKGQWLEPIPRCAKDVSNNVMIDRIEAYDFESTHQLFQLPKDGRVSRFQRKTALELSSYCIKIKYDKPSILDINLAHDALISYIEIGVKHEDLDTAYIDKLVTSHPILASTSKYRTCRLVSVKKTTRYINTRSVSKDALHIFLARLSVRKSSKSSSAFFIHILGFMCAMKSKYADGEIEPFFTKQIQLTFNVSSNISLCELHVYQPPPLKCGRPQSPFHGNVVITSLPSNSTGKDIVRWRDNATYNCDKGYDLVHDKQSSNTMLCSPDSVWTGSIPLCRPQMTCSLDGADQPDNLVFEIKDFVYYNRSELAIPGTTLVYSCKVNSTKSNITQLIGGQARECQADGFWSSERPICAEIKDFDPDHQLGSSNFSVLYTLIAALTATLAVGTLIVIAVFLYFMKKVKKSVSKETDELNITFKSGPFTRSQTNLPETDKIYEEINDYADEPIYDIVKDCDAHISERVKNCYQIDNRAKVTLERVDSLYDDVTFRRDSGLFDCELRRNSVYRV